MEKSDVFSIQNLYEYLKKKGYSTIIQNGAVIFSLSKLCNVRYAINRVMVRYTNISNERISIGVYFTIGGYTESHFCILYTEGYHNLEVKDGAYTYLYSMLYYTDLYDAILNIILYNANKLKRLVLSIAYNIDYKGEYSSWKNSFNHRNGTLVTTKDTLFLGLESFGNIKGYTIEIMSKMYNVHRDNEAIHCIIGLDSISDTNRDKLENLIKSIDVMKIFPYIPYSIYGSAKMIEITNKDINKLI